YCRSCARHLAASQVARRAVWPPPGGLWPASWISLPNRECAMECAIGLVTTWHSLARPGTTATLESRHKLARVAHLGTTQHTPAQPQADQDYSGPEHLLGPPLDHPSRRLPPHRLRPRT